MGGVVPASAQWRELQSLHAASSPHCGLPFGLLWLGEFPATASTWCSASTSASSAVAQAWEQQALLWWRRGRQACQGLTGGSAKHWGVARDSTAPMGRVSARHRAQGTPGWAGTAGDTGVMGPRAGWDLENKPGPQSPQGQGRLRSLSVGEAEA